MAMARSLGGCRIQWQRITRVSFLRLTGRFLGIHQHPLSGPSHFACSFTSTSSEPLTAHEASTKNSESIIQGSTQLDFLGEPISLGSTDHVAATEAFDQHLLNILSRGRHVFSQGGDLSGTSIQAHHGIAISWMDCLNHPSPMMTVLLMAPLAISGGPGNVKQVDKCIHESVEGSSSMTVVIQNALKDSSLTPREQMHVTALDQVMQGRPLEALRTYVELITLSPGDILALSFALDLCFLYNQKDTALHAVTSVACYHKENYLADAWISYGLAIGGAHDRAEQMAQRCHSRAMVHPMAKLGSPIASQALSIIYEGQGRRAEGVTMFAGFDGIEHFRESTLDAHLSSIGARMVLDRDGLAGANLALRIFDEYFQNSILSRYSRNVASFAPAKSKGLVPRNAGIFSSIFNSFSKDETPKLDQGEDTPNSFQRKIQIEDILTHLPPTATYLTDATLLLLRLRLTSVIGSEDDRWNTLRACWKRFNSSVSKNGGHDQVPMIATVASSLLLSIDYPKKDKLSIFLEGVKGLGQVLDIHETKEPSVDPVRVVSNLAIALPGRSQIPIHDLFLRSILEHALCHVALLTEDYASLSTARAICSQGVTLRPNCPESWWRYSLVLDGMGDNLAAEDAREASYSFSSGVRSIHSR